MRRCFLHIGTHKTATTSIQRLLDGRPQELQRDGFFYPPVGRPSDAPAGHHNLAWEISSDRRFRSEFGTEADLVRALASTGRNVILSSEDFEISAHYPERFGRFIAAIQERGIGVSLLIFLRNQIDYAESLYSTLLLFGFTQPFSAYCDDILGSGEVRWREWIFSFRYDKFLGDLEAFANVEVTARSYDRPAAGSPVLDFLSIVGLDPQRLISGQLPRDNQRPDLGDCIRRYWKNRAGLALDERHLETFLASLRRIKAGWPTMNSAHRAQFAEAFGEANRRLCERHRLPPLQLVPREEPSASPALDEIFGPDSPMQIAVHAGPDEQK